MSATYALTDSVTMLRRNLVRFRRYPAMSTMIILIPIILMLMFDFFFGGALKGAIGGDAALGGKYVNYLVPGLILMIPAYMIVSVAVSVCSDMTKGIVKRFRTMQVSPSSILFGHVIGAMIQAMLSVTALIAVALLIGFRPTAGVVEWCAAAGLFAMTVFAFVWLAAGFGLAAKTPESASNMPFPIMMLPYLGSGLVPTEGMPAGVRQFAQYQPFSPIAETLRGLLMGTAIGNNGVIAIAWCVGIGVIGYVWSTTTFRRKTTA
ncbi:ABC transporter permease [Antrihabitans cavernicola]|uniref:Transport permease protein n=1 Tax=Antrihabitans cavernicola TaxID=2495913 RepID=A0A5A7S813_9NOCA|nr:ABC transporter permease [Spelaeibacter cavernicola]KAA0021614.1 ABC transporter permease [Spelaeibacter cavernicola]